MLIRVPDSWPPGVIAVLAMLILAVLDLGGALSAKEAVVRRSLPMGVVGLALFVLLFWVYASSLEYAELAPVTLGWVALLQVGVLLLDRFRYETPISRGQWVAVVVMLAAQAYLFLGAPAETGAGATPEPATVPPQRSSLLHAEPVRAQIGPTPVVPAWLVPAPIPARLVPIARMPNELI